MSEFNLTLFEVCEALNKSRRTIGRYIRQERLHPQIVKSKNGTLEYRFSFEDLDIFKSQQRETGHETRQETRQRETRQDTPDITGDKQENIINLLKETATLLKDQLKVKDEQIGQLLKAQERSDFILAKLQERVFLLEEAKETKNETGETQDSEEIILEELDEGVGGMPETKL